MRWTSAVVVVSALSSSLVVLPTVTVPAAAARPVLPSVDELPLRGVDPAGLAESPKPEPEAELEVDPALPGVPAPPPSAAEDEELAPVAVTGRLRTGEFSAVGVTWQADGDEVDVAVQVRTRSDDGWSDWTEVEVQASAATDADGLEGERSRTTRAGSDPLFVGPSDAVQVRVDAGEQSPRDLELVLVDPGTSPADASVGDAASPVLGGSTAGAAAAMPDYVSRAGWGADESLRTCEPSVGSTIKGGILHTTATGNDYSAEQSAAVMRSMYAYHTKSLGWCDLGYNLLVDRFGTLFEGRWGGVDRPVIGAHTGGFNTDTFGVSMIGNHDLVRPSESTLETVRKVFAWKLGLHGLDPQGSTTYTSAGGSATFHKKGAQVVAAVISGHRDYSSKSCPGNYAYPLLPSLRAAVAERTRPSLGTSTPPTTVTFTSTPAAARYGTATTLRGRLTTLAGQPVAGRPVALSVRRPGTSGWAALSTRTTGADGRFSGTHTPLTTLEYRAAWAGDTVHLPAERRTRVEVSTVVRAALSAPRVRPGGTLTLRGSVVPAHPGQKVQRQQLVRGRWTTLATATLSRASAYTFPITTSSTGAKTYRVVKPADGDHAVGVSPTLTLTVR